ncbi:MAG TPA: pitrilysin family protein [Steroidobacteraceae bacterium]|nr:pitrilysin family protein [Steroidobacteraceae bacterium]
MTRFHVLIGLLFAAMSASADMAEHAQRSQVAGIDLVTYVTGVKDVVIIHGALPAGDAFSGAGNAAVPTLTGMMLDRGTRAMDQFAIAQQLENVGAEISFGVGTQSLEIRAKCLKKDLPLVIGIIASELRTPALSAQEFAKAKQQFSGLLESSLQSTEARSQEAFKRAVFASGHPNRPHTLEEFLAAVKAATLDEVKAFHAKFYGPAHLTLVLAGDVSSALAVEEVGRAFGGWTGGYDYLAAPAESAPSASEVKVPLEDKTSVSVIMGQATGLRYKDPDALALRVGTAALGRGFTGRLMSTVRDKEGLTYDIGAGVTDDALTGGAWELTASFAPKLLDKGIESSRREMLKWWKDGITERELSLRKQGMIGSYFVGLATTGGVASTILSSIQRGYDLTWLDRYPRAVDSLSLSEVNAAIKTHLNPNAMALVEAGSIPPPPPPAPAPTP